MSEKDKKSNHQDRDQRKSILGRLFSRPAGDQDYVPDLKDSWNTLDSTGRIMFIIGALIGLILFLGALVLAYLALSALIR